MQIPKFRYHIVTVTIRYLLRCILSLCVAIFDNIVANVKGAIGTKEDPALLASAVTGLCLP